MEVKQVEILGEKLKKDINKSVYPLLREFTNKSGVTIASVKVVPIYEVFESGKKVIISFDTRVDIIL